MDNHQVTYKTWNKIAIQYHDKFMESDLYNDTYDYICNSIIKDKAKLLEIGCGPGNITKYLLTKRPDFEILGIDIAPNMIELAKRNNPTAQFEVKDVRKINTINEKFDAIVCGFCIPYISQTDCSKLIYDCKNLLNNNGIFYLSFVSGKIENSGFISANTGDRMYFYYHDIDFIEKELYANSLKKTQTFFKNYEKSDSTNEIHTIMISKKQTHNII